MRTIVPALCALLIATLSLPAFGAVEPDSKTAKAPSSTASVTVPLDRYDELQKSKENASATVIDTMLLGGTFHEHNLTVTFNGRSVGTRAATNVVSDAAELTLSGCSGDALLLRNGKGTYDLVALAQAFTLRCEARPSGSDRLRMNVSESVLAVRSAVADGELVTGEETPNGTRGYTLVRQVVGSNETVAITATGRYLITLLPDATRFRYVIQVHNPNRSTSPLPLHLVSGEHLQQIDSAATYEPNDGHYIFAMPPGDSTITLSGELQGTSFAPPVEASLQYVVVESHPLLRPVMASHAKRISTGESGVNAQYRGAMAFEIGPHEQISWSITRLEALRAISYAVRSVTHTLFIPANGLVLGQSELNIENQGAPELVLPPKPEPTFVSLQDEPVLMTKNAAGQLTVPLSSGSQSLVVQHRQPIPQFGLLFAHLEVPRLPVPATYMNVNLRYPDHWIPLWQSFATQGTTWHPEPETLLTFLLLALWIERVVSYLGMSGRRIVAALLLAFAAMLIPLVLWVIILACGAGTLAWAFSKRRQLSLIAVGVLISAATVLVIGALFFGLTRNKSEDSRGGSYVSSENAVTATTVTDTGVTDTVDATKAVGGLGVNSAPPTRKADLEYQGLPAKFELPGGAHTSSFSQQLLAPERPQTITLVLLSATIVTWAAALLALLALWFLWRERAALRAGIREAAGRDGRSAMSAEVKD